MLHVRYDWRRSLLWVSLCLIFFLGSQKTGHPKAAEKAIDVARVEKQQPGFLGRKWVK